MENKQIWQRRVATYGILAAVGFMLAFASTATGWIEVPEVELRGRSSSVYAATGRVLPGRELAFIFIGSPTCAWSNARSLPDLVELAKVKLLARSDSLGSSFSAMAAVKSSSTDAGSRFLQDFGAFDEIALGRGWMNTALRKYLYESFPARPATPQIVVLERRNLIGPPRQVVDERVLARIIGFKPIEDWVQRGSPLPRDDAEETALPASESPL